MRIVGFLQNFQGANNGYLRQCLRSMSACTDHIVVYDDASTEDVRPIYEEFGCTVIYGLRNEFHRELYHKQQLLYVALTYKPTWILWFDSDAILGRQFETRESTEATLNSCDEQGIVLLHLHNLNLWRSNRSYRVDNSFNDLWHGVWWRNTGELHYVPVARLHQKQYPQFWLDHDAPVINSKFPGETGKLIHLGFSTDEDIAAKYFKYRENGQTGWALDRLVTEDDKLDLQVVPDEWFPQWYLDEHAAVPYPGPRFTPEDMAKHGSLQEWQRVVR